MGMELYVTRATGGESRCGGGMGWHRIGWNGMDEMDWRDHGEVRQLGQASQVSHSSRQSTKAELRRYLPTYLPPLALP